MLIVENKYVSVLYFYLFARESDNALDVFEVRLWGGMENDYVPPFWPVPGNSVGEGFDEEAVVVVEAGEHRGSANIMRPNEESIEAEKEEDCHSA